MRIKRAVNAFPIKPDENREFFVKYEESRKTLHSLIPTFLSTRNENDRCDRKTH